jgi:hypothetical protein
MFLMLLLQLILRVLSRAPPMATSNNAASTARIAQIAITSINVKARLVIANHPQPPKDQIQKVRPV